MQTDTYQRLRALRQRHGPREFGKTCQKLLALAFRAAGCGHVVERGVQGVDIDAAWEHERYATEVKTTTGASVVVGAKDVAGLADRRADGYHPILAVLRLSPLSRWLLVDAVDLPAACHDVETLRHRRRPELERRLQPRFEQALDVHFDLALAQAQAYLDQALRSAGVAVEVENRAIVAMLNSRSC